jgi:hypothetical protein
MPMTLAKPATPNQFGKRRIDAKRPGRDSEIWTTESLPRLTQKTPMHSFELSTTLPRCSRVTGYSEEGLPVALDELSLKPIDKKKLQKYALRYPKSVQRTVRELQ